MWIALTVLMQALVLAWVAPVGERTWGLVCAAGLLAVVVERLWAMRAVWNAHIDMVLIMAGWGGLGMLVGPLAVGAPACHAAPGAMWAGMLAMSAVPAWRDARCLRAAYAERRLMLALVVDALGMAAGMQLAAAPFAFFAMTPAMIWLHHGAMLTGMTLGMAAAMALAKLLVPAGAVPANG